MSTPHPPLLVIILRYNDPLERLARRMLIHKHRAADVVKWAMEYVYEEGLFYEGPHLRAALIEQTKTMALGLNKALDIYTQMNLGGTKRPMKLAPPIKPSTSH